MEKRLIKTVRKLPFRAAHRLLLSHLWREKRLFFMTICLSLLGAVFEGIGIGLIIPFLQSLTDPGAEPFGVGIDVIDQYLLAVDASPTARLFRVSGLILLSAWMRTIISYFAQYFGVRTKESILHNMRMEVLDQLQKVSLRYYAQTRTGEIINSLTNEIQRLRQLFGIVLQGLVRGSLLMVYVTAMFLISYPLALFAIVFFGTLSLFLDRLVPWIRERSTLISRANGALTSTASELINGMRTILSFGTQEYEKTRFADASCAVAEHMTESNRRSALMAPIAQGAAVTILIGMIIVAVQFFILPGRMDATLLLVFLFALFRMMPLVQELNTARGMWATFSPSLGNIYDLLRTDDKPYIKDGTHRLSEFRDMIIFEDVDFEYEPGKPVLRNISLEIPRGKTTALVGASGAGKTTLVDLIPRFYDPTGGRILIDGIPLTNLKIGSVREKIAIVSQETFLFNDTVKGNITYGLENISDRQLDEVADKANALEFIRNMADGFNTKLGDRGVRLSGGQRQRIAIARALLRDPEILILDEATSALDSISEKLVQRSLEYLMKDRTVIVIAHRLSTVENADRVVVLEEGEIVEQGTYQDLLELKGQFWSYHSIQYQLA